MFFHRDRQNTTAKRSGYKYFIKLFSLVVSERLLTRLSFSHFLASPWNYWIILNERGKKVFHSMYPFLFLLTLWCEWYILSCLGHWLLHLFLDWITVTVKCQNERNQRDLKYQHKLPGRICLTVKWKTWHSGNEKWEINSQVWVMLERKIVNSAWNLAEAKLWVRVSVAAVQFPLRRFD